VTAVRGSRSVKRLRSVEAASRHQREWFAEVQARVADGEPLALVDAEAPHEILRALDVPYVVVQWWSSVCSAKQRGPHYLSLLRERGYPDDSAQYNAIPLGSALAGGGEQEPWGGLPRVSLVVSQVHSATHRRIGDAWAREHGAEFLPVESAVHERVPERWWERVPDEWEEVVGTRRLDLMTAEFAHLVERLEALTGRRFDPDRFARVMELANEHADWNRRARDRLASAVPAPIDIADSIPAVMLPQWHRGSEWGRDAARAFHDEIDELVGRGDALCPDERVRLMWIGRGLWFNLGFYQHFRERYGAVFVWSMYLAIAADGYARYGGEPLRALAARFAPFAEFLGMPGWANEWYLKEARLHAVDGVVNLVAPESRSSYFVTRSLEEAGIPVLEIDANNADAREWDEQRFVAELTSFVEERVEPVAARRRGAAP
jgi:hypothetical protein